MLKDTKVRIFTSSQPGAPGVNLQNAGGLLELLDACLVGGYGLRALDAGAMTRDGAVVTVAMGGHNHFDHSVLLIAGAAEAEYNGVHRIQVDDNNHFSFELEAGLIPATPATGTITAKIAPAGWTKPFASTNKAVYRPADGARHYLRVDDGWTALKAKVRAFRAMTDIDTGTGMYPDMLHAPDRSSNWMKPDGEWWVIADDKGMHLQVRSEPRFTTNYYFGWFKDLYGFDGDAASLLTVGSYNTIFNIGLDNPGTDNYEQSGRLWNCQYIEGNSPAATVEQCAGYMAKSYDSVQDCIPFGFVGYAMKEANGNAPSTMNDQTANPYAATRYLGNTGGNALASQLRGFTLQPPFIYEPSYFAGTTQLRGILPFLQCIGLYPSTARHGVVARNDARFGAFLSVNRTETSGVSAARGLLVPLGNWEDVL